MQMVVLGLVAWEGPESSSPTSATDAIKARFYFLFGQCLINGFFAETLDLVADLDDR